MDKRILAILQRDASISLATLSEHVGLSQTPCWKRIKKLEQDGYIEKRVTLLNRAKLGLGETVFVTVRTNQHDEAWLAQLADTVSKIPQVVEFYRMSGEVDYMLKIVCGSIGDYDAIYKKLVRCTPMYDVSSYFAMEQIKYTTEIPLFEI